MFLSLSNNGNDFARFNSVTLSKCDEFHLKSRAPRNCQTWGQLFPTISFAQFLLVSGQTSSEAIQNLSRGNFIKSTGALAFSNSISAFSATNLIAKSLQLTNVREHDCAKTLANQSQERNSIINHELTKSIRGFFIFFRIF